MITKPPAARDRDLTRPYVWTCPGCGHTRAVSAQGVDAAVRQAREGHTCSLDLFGEATA